MAMRTKYRSYEFLMMLFGLCNSPSTFIFIMNSLFHKELYDLVVVYIDNIIVFCKTKKDYAWDLEKVLSKLRE